MMENSEYTKRKDEKVKLYKKWRIESEKKLEKYKPIKFKEYEIRDYFYGKISDYGIKLAKRELIIENLRIDLFAIGIKNIPYIIEFKRERNKHIVGQATQYLILAQNLHNQIENEVNFKEIDWNQLSIICIAPGFYERDFKTYDYGLLKGRIHFYKMEVHENDKNSISGISFEYKDSNKIGPLKI